MYYVLAVTMILVATTITVGIKGIKNGIETGKAQKILGMNMASFFGVMIAAAVFMIAGGNASAADAVTEATVSSDGMRYLAAALSTGLACVGTGIAVAISGSAAIGAISENEKLLGKTIIFVGLAEGIAIYGLIISIMILGA